MAAGDARALTAALRVHEDRMAFEDVPSARAFAEAYLACDERCWSNPRIIGLYAVTAEALRVAMARGVVGRDDLWATDGGLWAQMTNSLDPDVRRLTAAIDRDAAFALSPDGDIHVTPKVRVIDPDVIRHGEALALSAIDAQWRERMEDYRRAKAGEWRLRKVMA
jgi:hypothetical protein